MQDQTIVQRINLAGETLGVSPDELSKEVIRLYNAKDQSGMKELFQATLDWERRLPTAEKEVSETVKRVSDNLDYICQCADNILDGMDVQKAVMLNRRDIGPIQKFYRDSIKYFPYEPIKSNPDLN